MLKLNWLTDLDKLGANLSNCCVQQANGVFISAYARPIQLL